MIITSQQIARIREQKLEGQMLRLLRQTLEAWEIDKCTLPPSLGIAIAALLDKIN